MSNCGNCRSRLCTCQLIGDGTNTVRGIGSSYEPFQARPISPSFRSMDSVRRTATQSITADTDTVIVFEHSEIPHTAGDMWIVTAPTRLTASIAGLYLVGGSASQSASGASQIWSIWIRQSGTTSLVRRTVTTQIGAAGPALHADVMTLVRLAAGDYIELMVRSNRTASTPLLYNIMPAAPRLWAQWMDE